MARLRISAVACAALLAVAGAASARAANSRSQLLRALAAPLAGEAAGKAEVQKTNEFTCAQHTLCGSCLEESNCVWCADDQGSCVPGSVEDGPSTGAQCTHWEGSYCTSEPCAHYTQCSTCVSDAFCGWSASESKCVEGDSKGPLTGRDRDDKWVWASCPKSHATGGATGLSDSAENRAADALNDAEKEVQEMEKGEENAQGQEKKMIADEKKAFNAIAHLRSVINAWKARKLEIASAAEQDHKLFSTAFDDMANARKDNFEKLLQSYQHMKLSLEKDEELLRKRQVQEEKFADADQKEDAQLEKAAAEADSATGTLPKEFILPEDHSMGKLEEWIKGISAKEAAMLRKLSRHADGGIGREMHMAMQRKMNRHEALIYACQFLLSSANAQCADWHQFYAGEVNPEDPTALSEEEHMRVCNSARDQLDDLAHRPHFLEHEGQKDQYLKWCTNNMSE